METQDYCVGFELCNYSFDCYISNPLQQEREKHSRLSMSYRQPLDVNNLELLIGSFLLAY